MIRSSGSGTISFGLVAVPVKLFVAAADQSISFHLLHGKCGGRIKNQQWCPSCNQTLDRSDCVKGFEYAKDQYVRFTQEELDALEQDGDKIIDIQEFIPMDTIDPVYYQKTYYLGPDKGGEKAYSLLHAVLRKEQKGAIAKYIARGKEHITLIRSVDQGLVLHLLFYGEEVREFTVMKGDYQPTSQEVSLGVNLVNSWSSERFDPTRYQDERSIEVMRVVEEKVQGKEVTRPKVIPAKTQVVDLMEALKASLEKRKDQEPKIRKAAKAPKKK